MTRTITISAGYTDENTTDADRWEQLKEQCGGDQKPVLEALGYLSMWNREAYPVVNIVLVGERGSMELIACYRVEENGPIGYSIGAVWHGDHFGFHS